MTPEELAVIQAAMELRDKILAHPEALRPLHNANSALTPVLSELSRVTRLLVFACPQCNAGGHVCPGDGNSIPHGASDCGEHAIAHYMSEDLLDACGSADRGEELIVTPVIDNVTCTPCGRIARKEPDQDLIFVLRTWEDVRTGDRVRMPGSDATAHVQSAVHLRWHVKPGTGTSQYNPPVSLPWSGVRVTLEVPGMRDPSSYEMDPVKPVEIEIDRETAESAALLHGGEDWWEVRAGLVAGRKEAS